MRSSGRALRKTARDRSYLESSSSGNDTSNKQNRENTDPGKSEPSLAQLFAPKFIDLKHGRKPKPVPAPSPLPLPLDHHLIIICTSHHVLSQLTKPTIGHRGQKTENRPQK